MDLSSIQFAGHDQCDALTASITALPPPLRREQELQYRDREFLWLAADLPSYIYVLQSGRIEITETDRKGRSRLLRTIQPGQMFGYLCFCGHQFEPQGTEARAITASVVLRTGREDFQQSLRQNASTVTRLVESLCLRVSEADRRAGILAIHGAKKRLATLLLSLADSQPTSERSTRRRVVLYISHAELAALASLTRPHTTVLMNRFRAMGCVSYDRGTPIYVEKNKLRRDILDA